MESIVIRKKFFDFFINRGHEKVSSSSLIPVQDPTLLFTNAGMNQFKDVFLGIEKRTYSKAVSIQKCMRAGGKHNDLDNVGFTSRHLTFFEMMGNFSFGDYFKNEAIEYAWEFLTQNLLIDSKVLLVTVFDDDDESFNIWHKIIGLKTEKIYKLGAAENFWQMGDTGPCGPCTEILVDRGVNYGCGKQTCTPGCPCDRFMEIWNNVFMQYDRQANGELIPLKQTGVDTGMGIERLCMIMQNKDSVFETDLFDPIIKKIEELTNTTYAKQSERTKAAFHVIADHIRASCFLIADGCSPANEGRGYVLRKIIRRAALFEQKLIEKSMFSELASTVINKMGPIYPELIINEQIIKSILKSEIDKFASNLIRGRNILEQYLEENKNTRIITGLQAFKLYDTFGFPLEIIEAAAKEQGYNVDIIDFETQMNKQKESSGKKMKNLEEIKIDESIITEFIGYKELKNKSEVIAIIRDNSIESKISGGQTGWIITKQSPFFVETGGQVSDKGWIEIKGQIIEILDLKKIGKAIGIKIKVPFQINISDEVISIVDSEFRINTMKNHTATHLLQAALIELLGKQVKQSGSVVTPDYLRFDFTYHRNLTLEEIQQVENIVNRKITENIPLNIYYTNYKDAVNKGVIAIFGEKYNPDNVRVIDIAGFSAELCGGTHVFRTGDIGSFKITEVSALSAGNRRIVALTGPKSLELFQNNFNIVKHLSQEFKIKSEQVIDSIKKQKDQIKELQIKINKAKKQFWLSQIPKWSQKIEEVNKIPFLFLGLEDYDNADLKEIVMELNDKKSALYFIISNFENASNFICIIPEEFKNKISLKAFNDWLKKECNLHGGGKDNIIQGGGQSFDASLEEKIKNWFKTNTK